ncbi:hypothetical protein BGZ65_009810 [Modicella reniformis]|uniref:Uncharacterized protein n=1 Tax=Modicella reniformis TaxID=1440133 RepID=A0A9P6IMQ2_9FUNG|nr:hypothetical protein BGZ65_009810 [Modicella reniformis]
MNTTSSTTTLDAVLPDAKIDPAAVESEKIKLTQFTKPNTTYFVESLGTNKEICRVEPNGQKSCVKFLTLEAKQMFTLLQDQGLFCTMCLDPNKTTLECKRV